MQQDGFQRRLQFADTGTGELCGRYTRDQLLAVTQARLTPNVTPRLREGGIGFDLPPENTLDVEEKENKGK